MFSDDEKIKIKKNLKKEIIGIDKETRAGCKIVKLSLGDNNMIPYNIWIINNSFQKIFK